MNKSPEIIEKESIFKIGNVVSVRGRTITVSVDDDKNLPHTFYKGNLVKNAVVGSYVKVAKGFTNIIAKIETENSRESKDQDSTYSKQEENINRFLTASILGYYENQKFIQGATEIPLIGSPCYLLDKTEFSNIHKFAMNNQAAIRIGSLTEESTQAIQIGINRLFASHIGIFGNTGSGKSNTLTRIYSNLFKLIDSRGDEEILKKFINQSQFVFIDFNGEYAGDKVFHKSKKVYKLTTGIYSKNNNNKYPMSYDCVASLETLSILLGATEKTQQPFLRRAIRKNITQRYEAEPQKTVKKIIKNMLSSQKTSVGTETIFNFIDDIYTFMDQKNASNWWEATKPARNDLGKFKDGSFYIKKYTRGSVDTKINNIYAKCFEAGVKGISFKDGLLDKIRRNILMYYYESLSSNRINIEHVSPLINRMRSRFIMLEKVIAIQEESTAASNIIVLSLKDVNLEMKKIIPLLVCKQLYDSHKSKHKEEGTSYSSVHMIIDEAHNILSKYSEREAESIKDYRLETFEEIIKEGRKFGVFLTIASQRPQDISPTIISQLHNYFIHRLINTNDIEIIGRAVSYLDKLSYDSIPILPVGHCFIAGTASSMPVKVCVDRLDIDEQPASQTIDLEETWGL